MKYIIKDKDLLVILNNCLKELESRNKDKLFNVETNYYKDEVLCKVKDVLLKRSGCVGSNINTPIVEEHADTHTLAIVIIREVWLIIAKYLGEGKMLIIRHTKPDELTVTLDKQTLRPKS